MKVFNLLEDELEPGLFERPRYGWRALRLGSRLGASLLGISVYELEPGQRSFPYHYHLGIEEWLLVLAGRPTLRGPEGDRELVVGDIVVFRGGPAGAHQVRNDAEEPARIAILSNMPPVGGAVYPDSDKLGLAAPGVGERHLVRDTPQLDYWDGED